MATLLDIRNKVRRVTGKLSANEITDAQINQYINDYYIYDFPEQLRLQNLRVNYQFVTNANQCVYDFPTDLYLDNMPPVYIGGYQSFMTQTKDNFFRINPQLNYLQQTAATGNGTSGPYTLQCTATPITRGFKPNPPGAYSISAPPLDPPANILNWMVLVSGIDGTGVSRSLVDDGQGNLFDPSDISTVPAAARGTINYITGAVAINATGFVQAIPTGNPINIQYVPYVASRPQSVMFYADQFYLYPIPDQAYTVSFEAFKYPTALGNNTDTPQLNEWWQALAYGAADKIFADSGDIENMMKFRPLLDEQLKLVQRRTVVQQTSERAATIYTEQANFSQYPFGNPFSGF